MRLLRRDDDDCVTVRKLSSEYLEEDLPQNRLQRIKVHLDGCGPCRAFVNGLSRTIGMLGRLPKAEPPAHLKQSIVDRTRQEEKGQR